MLLSIAGTPFLNVSGITLAQWIHRSSKIEMVNKALECAMVKVLKIGPNSLSNDK